MSAGDALAEAFAALALRLAKRLADLGQAAIVEDEMIAVIDPAYEDLSAGDAMCRMTVFADQMRQVTGYPKLPQG